MGAAAAADRSGASDCASGRAPDPAVRPAAQCGCVGRLCLALAAGARRGPLRAGAHPRGARGAGNRATPTRLAPALAAAETLPALPDRRRLCESTHQSLVVVVGMRCLSVFHFVFPFGAKGVVPEL